MGPFERLQAFRRPGKNLGHTKRRNEVSKGATKAPNSEKVKNHPDLAPCLDTNVHIVFIGFNPGITSSTLQQHYAHRSNSFWKLFNEAQIVSLSTDGISRYEPKHDQALLASGVGFTDLVLRCTKLAAELSMKEKTRNVPRLLGQLRGNRPEFIVFVGKGIWEAVVAYLNEGSPVRLLDSVNFQWGLQLPGEDVKYGRLLDRLERELGYKCQVYVFASTSGLAAKFLYSQKLAQWQALSHDLRDAGH